MIILSGILCSGYKISFDNWNDTFVTVNNDFGHSWKSLTYHLTSSDELSHLAFLLPKVKPRRISPSRCLGILQPGPCDQRTKTSSEYQDAVWKGLVDATLRMPLHSFKTLSLNLLNVPLPLIPSRAAWRLTYFIWRSPWSTDSFIVWVIYCLWLFQCYLLTSAFEHGDFSPFLKLPLYKCNIIIIIVIIIIIINIILVELCAMARGII